MDTLFSRYRNAMVLAAVLFLQLVLLAVQIKRDQDIPLIRIWAVGIITPIEKLASGSLRGVAGVWHNYIDLRGARRENLELSEEVNRLKLVHHKLLEEAAEARRLRNLVGFRDTLASETVPARVIGSSASELSRVLFLNKGSQAGLRPNMPVITPDGIVGKIHRVFRGTAQVLVITDPDSGAGALLQKSRVHGALQGHGGFFCQLRYIVNDEKVEVGDRIYTSGEDRIYPKGLPIGVVRSVKPGGVFQEITVEPFAKLNRLEEVLVVVRGVDQPIPENEEVIEVAETSPAPPPAAAAAAPPGKPAAATPPGARTEGDPRRAAFDVSRPETDADRLQETFREQVSKRPAAERALGGLLVPTVAPGQTTRTDQARKPAPRAGAPGAPAPAQGSTPAPTTAAPPAGTPPAPAAGPTRNAPDARRPESPAPTPNAAQSPGGTPSAPPERPNQPPQQRPAEPGPEAAANGERKAPPAESETREREAGQRDEPKPAPPSGEGAPPPEGSAR